MAGQPKKAAMVFELQKRARDELDVEASVLDFVVHWTEGGHTMSELARSMSTKEYQFDRRAIVRYLRDTYGDEYEQRMTPARAIGAHQLVDDAIDIVDTSAADPDVQSKVRNQVGIRQFVATAWNRPVFGQPKAGGVTVNIGTLHIDALRQRTVAAGAARAELGGIARAFLSDGGEADVIADVIAVEDEQLSLLDSGS